MTTENQPAPLKKKKGLFARMGNMIFIGLIIVTPVVATVLIFNFLLRVTTSWFPRRLFPQLSEMYNGYLLNLLVLLAIVALLFFVGLFARNVLGKFFLRISDKVFSKIPFIRDIYSFVLRICEWIASSNSSVFESVVLAEYPKKGSYALGFITSATDSAISSRIPTADNKPAEFVNVFIPTTPNPTSGFFLIYRREEVIPVDINIETAINLIISAGAILPEHEKKGDRFIKFLDSVTNRKSTTDKG